MTDLPTTLAVLHLVTGLSIALFVSFRFATGAGDVIRVVSLFTLFVSAFMGFVCSAIYLIWLYL